MNTGFTPAHNFESISEEIGWTKLLSLSSDFLILNYNIDIFSIFPFFETAKEITLNQRKIACLVQCEDSLGYINERFRSVAKGLDTLNQLESLRLGQVLTYRELGKMANLAELYITLRKKFNGPKNTNTRFDFTRP